MPPLYLTEADVAATDALHDVVEAVADSFRSIDAGRVVDLPRRRIRGGGAMLHAMAAINEDLGLAAYKNYVTRREGARFVVGLHDLATAEPLAFLEADLLGRWRTAATTAVAARTLLRPGESGRPAPLRMLLIGTGGQAAAHLEAMARTLPLGRVDVFGRDRSRLERFVEHMRRSLGDEGGTPDIVPVDHPDDAVPSADLIVTATTSKTPVFDGRRLDLKAPAAEGAPKALICAIGSNSPSRRELDRGTVARADLVICDAVAACRQEAGELLKAVDLGVWSWADATDLASWSTGRVAREPGPDDVVLFKSVGLASEDLAAAAVVLGKHRELTAS
ncbi:MAG: ornithine cyclodeaminase family protein [Planctomycetota bacterium]